MKLKECLDNIKNIKRKSKALQTIMKKYDGVEYNILNFRDFVSNLLGYRSWNDVKRTYKLEEFSK